jgi:hypothetical protein
MTGFNFAERVSSRVKPISANLLRFAALFSTFILVSCGPPKDHPVLGSIFQIEGNGTISGKSDSTKSRTLSRNDNLTAGDEIRLQANSVAVLCLTPGIYLRCFGESHIRIDALTISKDGDETGNAMHMRRATIRLEAGRFHVFLPDAGGSRGDLRIDSPRGTFAAKAGTLFSLSVAADSARVLCARGEIDWKETPSGSTKIGAGYFLDRENTSPAPGEPTLASDDPAAQMEIVALLESADSIMELENTARNAPAPWRRQ